MPATIVGIIFKIMHFSCRADPSTLFVNYSFGPLFCKPNQGVISRICFFFRFHFLLLILKANALILRHKCGSFGRFTAIKKNQRLGKTFKILHGLETYECQNECILDKKCLSINVKEDEGICELNRETDQKQGSNFKTVSADGWTYFSTRYDETAVRFNNILQ